MRYSKLSGVAGLTEVQSDLYKRIINARRWVGDTQVWIRLILISLIVSFFIGGESHRDDISYIALFVFTLMFSSLAAKLVVLYGLKRCLGKPRSSIKGIDIFIDPHFLMWLSSVLPRPNYHLSNMTLCIVDIAMFGTSLSVFGLTTFTLAFLSIMASVLSNTLSLACLDLIVGHMNEEESVEATRIISSSRKDAY